MGRRPKHSGLTHAADDRLFAAVVDNVVDGVVTMDVAGTIQSFNRAACRIFGYPAEEVVGKDISLLMPEPHRSRHAHYVKRYLDEGNPRILGRGRELEGVRRDGTVFPLHLAVSEVESDGRRIFAGIVRDISELKRAQRALEASEQRYQALQLQHTQLERMAVAGELAGMVAHEVRTPLNALSLNTQMLARRLQRLDLHDERLEQIATTLGTEIARINEMLSDYLRIFRRPSSRGRSQSDLAQVTADAIRFIAPLVGTNGISVTSSLDDQEDASSFLYVHGDEERLRQVLLNLLLNAVEALSEGGCITVEHREEGGEIVLVIADSGPGIPPKIRERIFRPFVTTKDGGTGLGLAISERLVREMGGSLALRDPPPSRGTAFELRLPRVTPASTGSDTARRLD